MTTPEITIHTDGSCLGNPGKGGYAAVVRRYENGEEIKKRIVDGSAAASTNNKMELKAAITGLRQLARNEQAMITVISDSEYLVKGMTERLPIWQAKGWRTSSGKPVKNQDLWEELLAVTGCLNVHWEWVRSHNGDPRNEEADQLANAAAKRA
ncbi:ribonuclease HI [Pseudophaeobacter sp.]|uniref:ribonuclease HI n=1 Tax=Pseudophaeobacter sp. TaxID=1971739 RepID=UPI004059620C